MKFLQGMLSARGQLLLFADADGATKFEDYEKLERVMVASRCKVRPERRMDFIKILLILRATNM